MAKHDRNSIRAIVTVSIALIATFYNSAIAHKGADHRLKISINNEAINCEVSLPASLLPSHFDVDENGELSVEEFTNKYNEIEKWIDERFRLIDQGGATISANYSDMPVANINALNESEPIDNFRVIRRFQVPVENKELWLLFDLFENGHDTQKYAIWQPAGVTHGTIKKKAALLKLR